MGTATIIADWGSVLHPAHAASAPSTPGNTPTLAWTGRAGKHRAKRVELMGLRYIVLTSVGCGMICLMAGAAHYACIVRCDQGAHSERSSRSPDGLF